MHCASMPGKSAGETARCSASLSRSAEALAGAGIEAIAFKAPVYDIRGYCELGLRPSGTPALLLGEADMTRAVGVLGSLGYARRRQLSAARLDLIRRLQGNELLVKPAAKAGIGLYTRLAPMRAAFDIDHAGLWRRARRTPLQGRTVTTLAPEDELLLLAAQYGEAPSWSLGWATRHRGFYRRAPGARLERACRARPRAGHAADATGGDRTGANLL